MEGDVRFHFWYLLLAFRPRRTASFNDYYDYIIMSGEDISLQVPIVVQISIS